LATVVANPSKGARIARGLLLNILRPVLFNVEPGDIAVGDGDISRTPIGTTGSKPPVALLAIKVFALLS
jgi:hypothetical protein